MIDLLWRNRRSAIAPAERDEAKATFDRAIERYRQIARQASEATSG
jgi:hypothetical protein